MIESASPASMRMIEEVREAMRVHEISEYGEDRYLQVKHTLLMQLS